MGSVRIPSEPFCRPGAVDWFLRVPNDRCELGSLPPVRELLDSMDGSICVVRFDHKNMVKKIIYVSNVTLSILLFR